MKDALKLTVHQVSVEAVHKSYSQGCDVCTRLWNQLINSRHQSYGNTDHYPNMLSVYEVEPISDLVKTIPGHDETDPYHDRLSSSGLEYTVKFGWKERVSLYWHELPMLQYQVIAAESIGCIQQIAL